MVVRCAETIPAGVIREMERVYVTNGMKLLRLAEFVLLVRERVIPLVCSPTVRRHVTGQREMDVIEPRCKVHQKNNNVT